MLKSISGYPKRTINNFMTLTRKLNAVLLKKLALSLLFFSISATSQWVFGQNLSEFNWYFGNSRDVILFNKGNNEPLTDSTQATPFGTGGGAVISDPVTGDMIFYTDGNVVYDREHEIVPNGAALSGDPNLNSSAVVVPFPFIIGEYYIFTNTGTVGGNEIQYSIANRNRSGNATAPGEPARGEITTLNAASGLTNVSDGMIVVPGDTSNLFWLITNDRTTYEYQVLEIRNRNLGSIQRFDLNTPSIPAFAASEFAYHRDSLRLAVAPKDQNRNVVLLDFDPATGALSLNSQILNTGNADFASEAIYDIEWSRDGTKLYISRHGGGGQQANLYQYDLLDTLMNVNPLLANPVFRSFGLQRGPDERVYHLYQNASGGSVQVGRVNFPDSIASVAGYDPVPLGNTDFAATQFPSFALHHFRPFTTLEMDIIDSCAQATTKFFSNIEPTPQFYFWDFGDGNASTFHSPINTYDAAGTYTVTLSVFLNGHVGTVQRTVNIAMNDLMVDLGNDTTICAGETLMLDGGAGGTTYAWSTGEFTQTIEVDTTGTYWVAVTSAATGCLTYDDIRVTTYGDETTVTNSWYFGQMAGLDFDTQPPTALVDSNRMDSPAAASTISDINGDLLFYTNGVTVWNRDHDIMTNGTDIGGDSTSVQGVMIVPVPDDETLFYIFYTDKVWSDYSYDLKYAAVDIKRDTARGEVIIKDKSLYMNSTERMTATGFGGGLTWLITHEYGNKVFRAYPITANGIGPPAMSIAGSEHRFSEERNGTGQMKLAASGLRLGVALQDSVDNYLELFEFVDSTGMVTNFIQIDIEEPIPSLIYGVGFSSSLEKVYVTTNNNGSKIIQYDLDSIDAPTAEADIMASKFELGTSAEEFGALQTGPDGVMYLAIDSAAAVGGVTNPNGDDDQSQFNETYVNLGGRTSRLGLPNFVQNQSSPPQTPGISVNNVCHGQTVNFAGSGTSDIDQYFWTFGDGASAAAQDTSHVYNAPGTYNVGLRITNRCGLDTTLVETVTIFQVPVRPTVPDVVAICDGPVTLEAWPVDTTFTYTWSTGDTTRTISVSQPSTIQVFLTNQDGCSSETVEVLVGDGRATVALGPDRVICQNSFIDPLDAGNPGASYVWTVNGAPTGNLTRTQAISTNVAGSFEFIAAVTDPITFCVGRDTVLITVNPQPAFNLTPTNTSGCGLSDGEINVNVLDAGSFTYSLLGPSSIPTSSLTGPGSVDLTGLLAGTYFVNVTNTVSGCSNVQSVNVNDGGANFSINAFNPLPDCGSSGDFQVVLSSPPPASVTYTLFDGAGTAVRSNLTAFPSIATFDFFINDLDTGTYSVQVIDNAFPNCVQSSNNVFLGENPAAEFTVTPQNVCGAQGDVSITPITSDPNIIYTWTGPSAGSIIGSNIGQTITVSETGSYNVTSSGGGFCPQTQQVQVVRSDDLIVEINIIGQSCDGTVRLQADVTNGSSGNLSYLWNDGSNAQQLSVAATGTYDVIVRDQNTGCQGTATLDVEVFNELTVFINSEPNCDNNEEVFLTAVANITADVTFEWFGPTGAVIPGATSAEIAVTESGIYTVRVTADNNNCEDIANLSVVVIPITDDELLLGFREAFCSQDPNAENNQVTLDPGFFTSYEWRLLNEEAILSTDRFFTVNQEGVYEVTLSNGLTCIRDVITVDDDCLPRIVAPNAFTPNTDFNNDDFFVYPNPYVTNFEIFIYSRWGELVYHSSDINFRWDGTYRGEILQIGTYVYVMRFESSLQPEIGTIEQHGGVVLIR